MFLKIQKNISIRLKTKSMIKDRKRNRTNRSSSAKNINTSKSKSNMVKTKLKKRVNKSSSTRRNNVSKPKSKMVKTKLKKGVEKPSGAKHNLSLTNKKTSPTSQQKKKTNRSTKKKNENFTVNSTKMYKMARIDGLYQFRIDPDNNPGKMLGDDTFEIKRQIRCLPNVADVVSHKKGYNILCRCCLPADQSEANTEWVTYKKIFQEILGLFIDPLETMTFISIENLIAPEMEPTPISELIPVKAIFEDEAKSTAEKIKYQQFKTSSARLYRKAVQMVKKCFEYGIDLIPTHAEYIKRAEECASLGQDFGLKLFQLICSSKSFEDEDEVIDRYVSIMCDNYGHRDIQMFFWLYQHIYLPKIEEQIILEKEYSLLAM